MLTREQLLITFFAGFVSLLVGLALAGRIEGFSVPPLTVTTILGMRFILEVLPVVLYMLSVVPFSIFLFGMAWRPVKRREQARFFLLLLSSAEESGQSVEQTIISFSKRGKQSLGPQFDQVARHIESGLNLPEALTKVPGCLPAQVVAILKVGHETGGVSMTLPVAQENLREKDILEAVGWVYIVSVLLIATSIVWVLMVFVVPKFEQIFKDMLEPGETIPAFASMVIDISNYTKNIADALFIPLLLLFGVWFYCKKKGWLGFETFRLSLLPWRRKRLQRDYSYVLALLLDSGVPEARAIELAAQGTSSRVFERRARKVTAGLQSGMGLTEAIKLMDDSKEFQWRLTNALQTEGNFVDALSSWHQSLSAQADRQYQTFSTLAETTMILFLGLIVGCIMVGMFYPLVHMMKKIILW